MYVCTCPTPPFTSILNTYIQAGGSPEANQALQAALQGLAIPVAALEAGLGRGGGPGAGGQGGREEEEEEGGEEEDEQDRAVSQGEGEL